jgi:outer membrane protein, heavy metal efflux system
MKNLSSRTWQVRAAPLLLWLVAVANAAEAPVPREPLTLARAIELAATRSPATAAFAAETESLANRAQAEALRPNLVVESDFENFAGTGNASGADLLEATLRLSRILELGNKPALRRGVGAAELERLAADQQLQRLDLAAEVARRFIHVVSDQKMLVTAQRAAELARAARDVSRDRVEAGAASPAALGRSEIALARAQIAQEHAEHELASARVKLSVLWGDTNAGFAEASGDLFELPALESFDIYRERLVTSPDLARFASETRLQEARIRLAEARRSPDISLSAGIRRLEEFDDQALVASFSVPLGTRRRAELQERAARADRSRVDLDREARRLELHATLFDLYQEILHARTEAESLHEKVRPQAEAMLATTNEGYRAGRFSVLELADAQLQLIEVEREAIRAAAQFHVLLVEIQRLTGEPIRTLEAGGSP